MRIRVLFFGVLRDAVAQPEQLLDLTPPATAGSVLEHYRSTLSAPIWSSLAIAVNQQYAALTTPLADGDEVALLPPVSGGLEASYPAPSTTSSDAAAPEDPSAPEPEQVQLTRDPISSAALVAQLKSAPDGAIVVFDGIVRNNTRGRQTLYLVYYAYESMALDQMRKLAANARERFAIREVIIVHRLGHLTVGESSVLIVVASAHRGAAFDACRWLIDTLKQTIPIWKKEHFVDGAIWADGEPFPPQLSALTPAEPQA